MELWVVKRIHPGYRVVDFFAKNWEKSMKFGKNRRKLGNIAENWETSPKIGKHRRKLGNIAENYDHSIDPLQGRGSSSIFTRAAFAISGLEL
jgi:hypothetical protein